MAYKLKRGFFTEVNGVPVTKHAGGLALTSWASGFPKAILWHYTAGCAADIHDVLASRGISVSFSVDRDGQIHQYAKLGRACWHAFGMSHYAIGIEHTADPGTCELTDRQLEASARLSAAIVEYVKHRFGFEIPLRKLDAPVTMGNVQPGFFDHRDGDSSWNQNGHTDHLYRWSWSKYLDAVRVVLAPPTFRVTASKGSIVRQRTFGTLAKAWAWARELLKRGFGIRVVPKGPGAGPEG